MKMNMRIVNAILFISFITCLTTLALETEAQTIEGSAPSVVSVGQQFRLRYTVDTQDVKDFQIGNIPGDFEILMGPSTSSQSSFQIINGKTSSTSSITYTYILSATKEGTFQIPPASVIADGNQIRSNSVTIQVSGEAASQSHGSSQGQKGQGSQNHQTGKKQKSQSSNEITSSDLFIRVSANKKRVCEQEPILLTYKVYTLVDLTQLSGKMPDLKGFHTQEIQLPQQKSFKVETIDGKAYRTVTWSQYVMFPQMTGELEIPSITFEGIVAQRNLSIDPIEAFFNGGAGYTEVKKKIVAPGIKIQVDPLPQKPSNFSGAVGKSFSLSANIDKTETKTNEPITLKVAVSGTGNLKLMKQPVVEFPKDFDKYDAKQTDKTRLTANGLEGSMVYDFMAVPRHAGTYKIPPVEFTYYDTGSKEYKTLRTDSFSINVEKGEAGAAVSDYTGQSDVNLINKDIKYIKTGPADLKQKGEYFFGSPSYWICLAVMALLFVSLMIIFRQRAIDNANIGKMRGKKANKVATKRLRTAAKLMAAGKGGEFYDEVMRALWGYIGDKLNMPVESLSKDNISQRLAERNVDETTVNLFIGALDECEFERYAPGDAAGNMSKTYDAAITAIMNIEGSMRKTSSKNSGSSAAKSLILLAILSLGIPANAQKEKADSAYAKENYSLAIDIYEEILKEGVSSDIYYNLGNAYYRQGDITRAIINYERALEMSPGDPDIRHNLQMAQSMTTDRITPETEFLFITWWRSLTNMLSVDGWAKTALASMAIAILLALLYLFSGRTGLRKLGFFGSSLALLVFILSNILAWQQKDETLNRKGAIVTAGAAQVKSTPSDNGTDLFILHEGTKVIITDSGMEQWKEIRVADGKEGWIESSAIEII